MSMAREEVEKDAEKILHRLSSPHQKIPFLPYQLEFSFMANKARLREEAPLPASQSPSGSSYGNWYLLYQKNSGMHD